MRRGGRCRFLMHWVSGAGKPGLSFGHILSLKGLAHWYNCVSTAGAALDGADDESFLRHRLRYCQVHGEHGMQYDAVSQGQVSANYLGCFEAREKKRNLRAIIIDCGSL
jgi:hypothetical protein